MGELCDLRYRRLRLYIVFAQSRPTPIAHIWEVREQGLRTRIPTFSFCVTMTNIRSSNVWIIKSVRPPGIRRRSWYVFIGGAEGVEVVCSGVGEGSGRDMLGGEGGSINDAIVAARRDRAGRWRWILSL